MADITRSKPRSFSSAAPHDNDLRPAGRQGRGRIAGITAGLVLAGGSLFFSVVPGGGTTSTSSILDYYHSSGRRETAIILALVLVAGCLLTMWFFTELRARLAATTQARVAYGFAIAGAALIMAGAGIAMGPTGAQAFSGRPFAGAGVADALAQSGLFVAILCGVYTLAAAIFLFGLAALRQRTGLPRWLAVTSMAVAVLLLGSIIGSPAILLPVWLLVAGLAGLRSSRAAAPATRAPAV